MGQLLPQTMMGYRTDVGYSTHYQPQLHPHRLAIAAALSGRAPFDPDRPFTMLDLGCGFGLTTLCHAAAYPNALFFGIDARPAHVAWASEVADLAGLTNASFVCSTFESLTHGRLPAGDVIAAHGVWSWVGDETRRQIRTITAECLKPDGIMYVSYNALPGLASMLPIRRRLYDAFGRLEGTLEDRIQLAFAEVCRSLIPDHPMSEQLEQLARAPAAYLAHEFFNEHWRCFHAHEVAAEMSPIGLGYLGPADLGDCIDSNRAPDFRADLFSRSDQPARSTHAMVDVVCALTVGTESFGHVSKLDPTARRLMHRLQRAPASASQIGRESLFATVDREILAAAMLSLLAAHVADPVLGAAALERRRERTDRLNRALWTQALVSDDINVAASPVTGTAVHTTRLEQLFLSALVRQEDMVEYAAGILEAGLRPSIAAAADRFTAQRLPLLASLGVV